MRTPNRVSAAIHPPRADCHQRHGFSARDPLRIKGSFFGVCHGDDFVRLHNPTCRGRCNELAPRETVMRPRSSSATGYDRPRAKLEINDEICGRSPAHRFSSVLISRCHLLVVGTTQQ
jgi:hypothetical protein